jgi:hypothetical protein
MGQKVRLLARVWRIGVCCTAVIGAGGATWVDPPSSAEVPTDAQSGSDVATAPQSPLTISPSAHNANSPRPSVPETGIEVVQWRFTHHLSGDTDQPPQGQIAPGRPLYLWMSLKGTQAAIDSMRANHGLTVQVNWVREAASGAPHLVTDLTVGRPGLTGTLEQQVRRKGSFEWHSWARKDTLSPGTWTVSLTYPDGQPLACGPDAQPCRFTINVG